MQRHALYLTQELVLFSIADDDIEDVDKKKILCKIIEHVPKEFSMRKLDLPVITSSTKLCNSVGPQS
jgi:hypothetical protein